MLLIKSHLFHKDANILKQPVSIHDQPTEKSDFSVT